MLISEGGCGGGGGWSEKWVAYVYTCMYAELNGISCTAHGFQPANEQKPLVVSSDKLSSPGRVELHPSQVCWPVNQSVNCQDAQDNSVSMGKVY